MHDAADPSQAQKMKLSRLSNEREISVGYLLCEAPEGPVPGKRYPTLFSRPILIATKSYWIGVCCVLVVVNGCDSRRSPDQAIASSERAFGADDVREHEVANRERTDQQVSEFAEKWQSAVVATDVAAVRSLVDWNEILNRAVSGLGINEEFQQRFLATTTSPEEIENLIGTIAEDVNQGGSYRFVRAIRRGDHTHVIMRLLDPQGALNYHDLRLKFRNGDVIADGLFFASTGESYSDTLRRIVAVDVNRQDVLISRLDDKAKQEIARLRQVQEMVFAIRQGDADQTLALYAKLSSELQQQKIPMFTRIMATDPRNREQYTRAIDDFVAKYPNETAVGLITFDAAVFLEYQDLLLKSYDQLQRFTGGDPLLALMVGGVLANQGKPDEAKALTASIDPSTLGLAIAHDYKLSVAMACDDHPNTLKQLIALRDHYGYEPADLEGVAGFESFLASREYEAWKKSESKTVIQDR